MKISTHGMLNILRKFNKATEDDSARSIDQVKQTNPNAINQLIQLRFKRQHYFILLDETAEDQPQYIMEQIFTAKNDATGEIIENPISDLMTYGLPYKGKDVYLFQQKSEKVRLDVLLAERYPETSRSTWQKYIKTECITVNDEVITVPKREVLITDRIGITLPENSDFSAQELPIVYMDDDVIVVNKPSGILSHSKGALSDEFTVAEFFRRYTTVGLDGDRPGIVHRLDRDTSGIMIGARTPEAYVHLNKQFADRKAKKTYLAVTHGTPKQPKARINIPIGRNPSSPSTFRTDTKGKDAVTEYEVLASDDQFALIELHPRTGRTHQLRVHLAYIGAPVAGDRVYGTQKSGKRLFLHAKSLTIETRLNHPQTFTAPTPEEFMLSFPTFFHVEA